MKKSKSIDFGHFFTKFTGKRFSKLLTSKIGLEFIDFFSCQEKAYFWSKSDIYSKIDVQINLTGSEREKNKMNNEADLCKSLGFIHTNAEIHFPRAPREEEREILD